MKTVCENIDRFVSTEVRLPYFPRGIMSKFYTAARDGDDPIVFAIARALQTSLDNGKRRIGIFTGFWHPELMPNGESDGPIGAVALGKALSLMGAEILFCVEKELIPVIDRMGAYLETPVECFPLSRANAADNAVLAERLDCAVFIEKCGPNPNGLYRFASGMIRAQQDAPLEKLLGLLSDSGKLTIGIGDMGNEVGFGKIYMQAHSILEEADSQEEAAICADIVTSLSTDYLLPANTSNLGAYGIVAALALITGNLALLHQPEDERELLKIAAEVKCVDGGSGQPRECVDGVSSQALVAQVQIVNEMVTLYYSERLRLF